MKSSGLTLSAVALLVMAFLTACSSGTPKLRSITVTPTTATITKSAPAAGQRIHDAVLDTLQYTATGLLSDGSTPDETSSVTWSSSSPSVATISATGLATAVGPGTTTITATLTGVSGTATLTVTSVVSVAVTPVNPTIAGGATEQFIATATVMNGDGSTTPMDVSSDANTTWASATMAVATINSTGLATGVSAGTSVISATFGNASGNTTLTVGAAGPVSLVLTPATPNIAVSNSVAFTVQEKWSDNSLHNPSGAVTFSSGTPATATINGTTGVALGVAVGTSTITATEGALTGTATLTVAAAQARYAYVANSGDSTIGEYSVIAATGTFSPLSTPTILAAQPQQVIVDPNGLYVYCICGTPTNQTSAVLYNVTPGTGVLTAPTTAISTVVGTGGANRGVIDPTGQFMFVVDGNTNVVESFSISQADGTLTAVNSVGTGNFPLDVLIDHTGKYLYVVNDGDNTVSQYSIAADGTLAALTPATVNTGNSPAFSTIDPANKYLYVPNNGDGTLTIFQINSNGQLAGQSQPIITGASSVANVAVDPTNKYVYVLDSTVTTTGHLYGYNTGVGALGTALAGSPFALAASGDGESPTGIAIDPTGALVAVDNNVSGDISLLQAAPTTGTLTPSATSPVTSGSGGATSNPNFVVFYIAP